MMHAKDSPELAARRARLAAELAAARVGRRVPCFCEYTSDDEDIGSVASEDDRAAGAPEGGGPPVIGAAGAPEGGGAAGAQPAVGAAIEWVGSGESTDGSDGRCYAWARTQWSPDGNNWWPLGTETPPRETTPPCAKPQVGSPAASASSLASAAGLLTPCAAAPEVPMAAVVWAAAAFTDLVSTSFSLANRVSRDAAPRVRAAVARAATSPSRRGDTPRVVYAVLATAAVTLLSGGGRHIPPAVADVGVHLAAASVLGPRVADAPARAGEIAAVAVGLARGGAGDNACAARVAACAARADDAARVAAAFAAACAARGEFYSNRRVVERVASVATTRCVRAEFERSARKR